MAIITGIFAALLGLMFIALSVRTLLTRRRNQVAIGDGGNAELLRAVRVHGNFAEYAPFALLLLALSEINGASSTAVIALNAALLIGRCSHAFGVSQVDENYRYRVLGMSLTFTSIAGAAICLVTIAVVN